MSLSSNLGDLDKNESFFSAIYRRAIRTKKFTTMRGGAALKRTLGPIHLTLMGVGASIGAGIFVLTGIAAQQAGPGVTLSFAFAAFACVFNALCYSELSSRFPVSGSAYLYAYLSLGEFAAVLAGINLLMDYHVGAASIARALSAYIIAFLKDCGWHHPWGFLQDMDTSVSVFSINLVAPIILVLLTLILCRGAQESANVNSFLTATKMSIVLLVVIAGSTEVKSENWSPFAPTGMKQVFATSALVFFSYIGFDAVCNTAEECVNPQRDLPIGIMASLAICAGLYIAVCLTMTGKWLLDHRVTNPSLSNEGMVSHEIMETDAFDAEAPLTAAFRLTGGPRWISTVVDLGAVIGLSTTLLVGLYSQSRIYLSIARDGLLPAWLAEVHPQHKAPVNAQILCGVVAGVLAMVLDVSKLTSVLSIGILMAYSLVCIAVLYLRLQAAPTSHSPSRTSNASSTSASSTMPSSEVRDFSFNYSFAPSTLSIFVHPGCIVQHRTLRHIHSLAYAAVAARRCVCRDGLADSVHRTALCRGRTLVCTTYTHEVPSACTNGGCGREGAGVFRHPRHALRTAAWARDQRIHDGATALAGVGAPCSCHGGRVLPVCLANQNGSRWRGGWCRGRVESKPSR
jgi:APA family basic amino acid/polyamine antiporter